MFTGLAFARYLWRVYPGAMEFFENGVALYGIVFFGRTQVELRSSQTIADRVVVVVRPIPDSRGANTKIVQIPDTARADVFQICSAAPQCDTKALRGQAS